MDGGPSSDELHPAIGATHGHLWTLADGRGLHAPPGVLVRDPDTGVACCHFCGGWFRGLGSHVRAHGLTGAQYREAVGLSKTRPLAAPDVSAAISKRQRAVYLSSPEVRARLAGGQELARTGALAKLSLAATKEIPHRVAGCPSRCARPGTGQGRGAS